MEILQAIKARRSRRSYAPESVAEAELLAIAEAGCAAPSPLNQQPWRITAVTNPTLIGELAELAAATRDAVAEKSGKPWVGKYDSSFLKGAPAILAVAADPAAIGLGAYLGEETAHVKAASAAVQNMLLAAEALGLGSVWFTFIDKERAKALLGIDPALELVGLLPVGRPVGDAPKPPPKKPLEEVVRFLR